MLAYVNGVQPTPKPKATDCFRLTPGDRRNVSKRNVGSFLNETNSAQVVSSSAARQDFENTALRPSGEITSATHVIRGRCARSGTRHARYEDYEMLMSIFNKVNSAVSCWSLIFTNSERN